MLHRTKRNGTQCCTHTKTEERKKTKKKRKKKTQWDSLLHGTEKQLVSGEKPCEDTGCNGGTTDTLGKRYLWRATNYTCCKNCTPRNRLLQRQDLAPSSKHRLPLMRRAAGKWCFECEVALVELHFGKEILVEGKYYTCCKNYTPRNRLLQRRGLGKTRAPLEEGRLQKAVRVIYGSSSFGKQISWAHGGGSFIKVVDLRLLTS